MIATDCGYEHESFMLHFSITVILPACRYYCTGRIYCEITRNVNHHEGCASYHMMTSCGNYCLEDTIRGVRSKLDRVVHDRLACQASLKPTHWQLPAVCFVCCSVGTNLHHLSLFPHSALLYILVVHFFVHGGHSRI